MKEIDIIKWAIQRGYILNSDYNSGIRREEGRIDYIWFWGDNHVKAVGYEYDLETSKTGEELYFISPEDTITQVKLNKIK